MFKSFLTTAKNLLMSFLRKLWDGLGIWVFKKLSRRSHFFIRMFEILAYGMDSKSKASTAKAT